MRAGAGEYRHGCVGTAQGNRGPPFLRVGHQSCPSSRHSALPHVLVGTAPLLVLLLPPNQSQLLSLVPVSAEEGSEQDDGDDEGDGGYQDHCHAVEDGREAIGGEGGHRWDVSAPTVLCTGGERLVQPGRWWRWGQIPQGRWRWSAHVQALGGQLHQSQGQVRSNSIMRCGGTRRQKLTPEEIKGLATQGAVFFLHFGSPGRRRAM